MNHRSSGYQPDALTNCAMLRKRQMWESNPLEKRCCRPLRLRTAYPPERLRQESNLHRRFRRPLFFPLNYENIKNKSARMLLAIANVQHRPKRNVSFEPPNVGFGDRCCYPLSHAFIALPEGFEPPIGGVEIRCLHPFGHGNMSSRSWNRDGALRLGPWATCDIRVKSPLPYLLATDTNCAIRGLNS